MHIGLISCSKSKTTYAARARDLYQPSALFRGALDYLEGRVECIYVLSSKYGLLPLDQVAEPYDLKLTHATPAYYSGLFGCSGHASWLSRADATRL